MSSMDKSSISEFSSASKVSTALSKLAAVARTEKWSIKKKEIEFLDTGDIPFARGSGGKIYKAKWRGLVCAVKRVHFESSVSEKEHSNMLDDLGNEIALLSSLRHPNLVMFLGACFDDTVDPVLLMEYCENGSLEGYLLKHEAREKNIKLDVKLKFAREISLGMTFLHNCTPPIIHRDLKPSNILLSRDFHVKITDFGLAKFLPGKQKNNLKVFDTFKMTGETGSYRFMAPEVFKHEDYDQTVDVYSYAMILYWIMAGMKPFDHIRDAIDAATLAALDGARPPVAHIKNKTVSTLVQQCWDADPTNRPSFDLVLGRIQEAEKDHSKKGSFFRVG